MSIEIVVDNGSFKTCAKTLVEVEACACNFSRSVGVKNVEILTDIPMSKGFPYGQVTAIPKQTSLRTFIETTEYKTPEITEAQNFLFVIANIEKDYIQKEYTPILLKYKEMLENQRATKSDPHEDR